MITFNDTGQSATLRRKPQPKRPVAGEQIAVQAALKFITQQWATLNTNQKATWTLFSAGPGPTAYHNFVRRNTRRIRSLKGPGMTWPVEESDETTNEWIIQQRCNVNHNVIDHRITGVWKQTWGLMIFRKALTVPAFDFQYLIALVLQPHPAMQHYTDSPLPPIVHRYRAHPFSEDGATTTADKIPAGCATHYD